MTYRALDAQRAISLAIIGAIPRCEGMALIDGAL